MNTSTHLIPATRWLGRRGRAVVTALLSAILLSAASAATQPSPVASGPAPVTPEQLQRGSAVFHEICFACHQLNGRGVPGTYPPLAHSDLLLHHRDKVINVLLHGLRGPVKVNGKSFDNVMPVLNLTDRQIADVMTYVLNSWGNHGGAVTAISVRRQREGLPKAAGNQRPAGSGSAPQPAGTMGGHGMMADHGAMNHGN